MPLHTQFPVGFFSNKLQSLLSKFRGSGDGVAIARYLNDYYIAQHLNGEYCVGTVLPVSAFTPGQVAPDIDPFNLYRLVVGVDQETVGVTLSGGGWTTALATTQYFGGTYRRTSVTGNYAEYTTPAGVTRLGLFSVGSNNAGCHLVTIDGDATLANSLPTAQQLVDAGTLASTVLVANGGTLNPTDRILNQASGWSSPYIYFELADGITAGAHTVRITVTGYMAAGATEPRLWLAGFWYNTSTLSGALPLVESTLMTGSRVEFALSVTPTGATNPEWMGHANTEYTTTATIYLDDVAIALDSPQYTTGTELRIELSAYLRHPQTGSTDIGTVTRTTTINAIDGIHFVYSITWLVNAISNVGYSAMLPMSSTMNRGSNVADSVDYSLTNDNDSTVGNFRSQAAYMWQSSGNLGSLLYLTNLTIVNNWLDDDTSFLLLWDLVGGLNKIYAFRNQHNINIAPNDVWSGDFYVKFQYFTAGAEVSLAR